MLFIVILAVILGILTGFTGVGGVLLIPATLMVTDLEPHVVISSALAAFMVVGVVGTCNYTRLHLLKKNIWLPLCIGAFPCALISAKFNLYFPAGVLLFMLGGVIMMAGIGALHSWKALDRFNIAGSSKEIPALVAIGAFAGSMAGLTGAGGPILTIPIMVALGLSPKYSVTSGMPLQVTVSIGGTLGSLGNHTLIPDLLLPIGLPMVIGLFIGNYLLQFIPATILKRCIGCVCLVTGVYQCLHVLM